jgi:protein SCO1
VNQPIHQRQSEAPTQWYEFSAIAVAIAGFVFLVAHVTLNARAFTFEDARRIDAAEHRLKAPEVELQASDGRQQVFWNAGERQTQKLPTIYLVDFVFTRCQTVCVSLGTAFQRLQRKIKDENQIDHIHLISISFDVARDGPPQLKGYADRFGADSSTWTVAVPSSAESLKRLTIELGIVVIPDLLEGFTHNAAIHVIDGAGQVLGIYDYQNYEDAFAFAVSASQ